MNIFVLTETDFIKKIREGLHSEDPSVDMKEFLLFVHEVTNPSSPEKAFVLDALVIADLELRSIKAHGGISSSTNMALAIAIETAHSYILHKIEEYKASGLGSFIPAREEEKLASLTLNWAGDKTEFAELCYGLKLGNCFGEDVDITDIVGVLSKAFNLEITPQYARSRFYNSKMREDKSETAFLEKLIINVRKHMGSGYNVPKWITSTNVEERLPIGHH